LQRQRAATLAETHRAVNEASWRNLSNAPGKIFYRCHRFAPDPRSQRAAQDAW